MKLILRDRDQEFSAWFEPGDRCELRVSLTPGLLFEPVRLALIALGWAHPAGEQTHFAGEDAQSSHLFTRKWNKTNQCRTRRRALAEVQAVMLEQFFRRETLDKKEDFTGRRKVLVNAPIEQLPGLT